MKQNLNNDMKESKALKLKKIIKSIYQEGEIENIIKIDNDSAFEIFRDLDFIKTEREAAKEYKETLDMIEEKKDIEEMDLIPLVISCKSILILQTILFKFLESEEKEIDKYIKIKEIVENSDEIQKKIYSCVIIEGYKDIFDMIKDVIEEDE